jgi:hypothetical protein
LLAFVRDIFLVAVHDTLG